MRYIFESKEENYLVKEYNRIDYNDAPLQKVMNEIYTEMSNAGISVADSFLDVGCGRGYFLKYLEEREWNKNICGIDPSPGLINSAVSSCVRSGGFFDPILAEKSFDVVFTCHVLHHVDNPFPVKEVEWMKNVARKFIVIIEVNNTNIPTLLVSLLSKKVEPYAWKYNKNYVAEILKKASLSPILIKNMNCNYLSGDSFLHKIAAHTGTKPYNISICRIDT